MGSNVVGPLSPEQVRALLAPPNEDDPNMPRLPAEPPPAAPSSSPPPPPLEIFDVSADADAATAERIRAAARTDETLRILGDGLLSVALELVGTWGGPAGQAGAVAARLAREVVESTIERVGERQSQI